MVRLDEAVLSSHLNFLTATDLQVFCRPSHRPIPMGTTAGHLNPNTALRTTI